MRSGIRFFCIRGLYLALLAGTPALAQTDSLGTAAPADSATVPHFIPVPDRWRDIQPPPYDLNVQGRWYDPYNQNVLKGDYPILGSQNTFLSLTATTKTVSEYARSPIPSGVSTADPVSPDFFGKSERLVFNEFLFLTAEIFRGQTAFRPRDWELKVTAALNYNYVNFKENNNVNINVRKGDSRSDSHVGFQELSFEKHLFDISKRYDFISARIGIQKFGSDFRDFIFRDYNLGARLFGTADNNRWQYNLAFFDLLEKDTNSELNTVFDDRKQEVLIANLYRQDFLTLGYTGQLSFHYNHDKASEHVDENGVPVRPAILGDTRPHEIKAYYLGWTGDGHFGRLNINHALYQVFGTDEFSSAAGRAVDINARLAALELSVDKDWMRFKVSGMYASGDGDPGDGTASGFDSIVDETFFAGGLFSYWNQQGIRLGGVNLVNKLSPFPNLRPNKFEGQANYVNPGLFLANLGYDAELTPKLKLLVNGSYLSFVETEVLEVVLNQPNIGAPIGIDASAGFIYRPFLNNNAIVQLGLAALVPLDGFNDIYESPGTQFSLLGALALTY